MIGITSGGSYGPGSCLIQSSLVVLDITYIFIWFWSYDVTHGLIMGDSLCGAHLWIHSTPYLHHHFNWHKIQFDCIHFDFILIFFFIAFPRSILRPSSLDHLKSQLRWFLLQLLSTHRSFRPPSSLSKITNVGHTGCDESVTHSTLAHESWYKDHTCMHIWEFSNKNFD